MPAVSAMLSWICLFSVKKTDEKITGNPYTSKQRNNWCRENTKYSVEFGVKEIIQSIKSGLFKNISLEKFGNYNIKI